jgi:5-(carboxyamino)imidazole ribonucleotide synthase
VLMIGGGQLSRMTHQAAISLGINLRVLALNDEESAAQVVRDVALGAHDDEIAIRAAALGVDVITFDHEHVPLNILQSLESEGFSVQPASAALLFAQDKLAMRKRLAAIDIAIPDWLEASTPRAVAEFAELHGWPVVLKTPRGGYDGRGVWVCKSIEEVTEVMSDNSTSTWLVEVKVNFKRELSAQVARSITGEIICYPVVETRQSEGMCAEVVVPAENLSSDREAQIQRAATQIAESLNVTGMLAVELFDTGEDVLVNELAMRPHNSGHWSIDGAVTSQFENHLRAIVGWPLGDTTAVAPVVVMANIIGTERAIDEFAVTSALLDADIKLHMYGKATRPRRKIGHVTVQGQDLERTRLKAKNAANSISGMEHQE